MAKMTPKELVEQLRLVVEPVDHLELEESPLE